MSIVGKETIEVIAQTVGIPNLSPDAALALAPDVEYRVREIMQESIKCMRHCKRTTLTAADVDAALKLRNLESIHGFGSGDPLRFKRAAGHKDLFYIEDKDVEFKDVIEAPLPKPLLDTAVVAHWLAVEGVQPAIPENPSVEVLTGPLDGKKSEYKEDGLPVDIRLPAKHILSRELQLYYEKITELAVSSSNSVLFGEALASLSYDSGLQPLVPKFICFVADQVQNTFDFYLLFALMRVTRSLIQNPHIQVEPYLHQIMPAVLTCLGSRKIGQISDNHWELRNFAADLIGLICKRFDHVYHCLRSRVARTLLNAFLDPTKALPQHYGAIQGLAALGHNMVRFFIFPNLELYLHFLKPEMELEKQKNEIRRSEAWCVYGALRNAIGLCVYVQLKVSSSLLSLPARPIWKSKVKIVTAMPNKRSASMNNLIQQPPVKRVATDGVMPINSQIGGQGAISRFPTINSDASLSTMSREVSNEKILGSRRREVSVVHSPKRSGILAQAWKENVDVGHLLLPLFECFGENMLCFIPAQELSIFL